MCYMYVYNVLLRVQAGRVPRNCDLFAMLQQASQCIDFCQDTPHNYARGCVKAISACHCSSSCSLPAQKPSMMHA